jgi:hypothetical protein
MAHMSDFDEFVHDAYDRIVNEAGEDGVKVSDAKAAIADLVDQAISDERLDPPTSAAAVSVCIDQLDMKRKQGFISDIDYLLDALRDETILGIEDPKLAWAVPVGGGQRKTLGLCSIADLDEMISSRRRNMASVVAAFEKVAAEIDQLKSYMRSHDARIVIDLFAAVS